MKRPPSNLPRDAQPWGRWQENLADDTTAKISAMAGDLNSIGNQFRSRADNMESQIAGVPSVSNITRVDVPPFSVTRPQATQPFMVYDSPVVFINPPRPDRDYTANVIVNMKASGVQFPFSFSMLRVNGVDYMFRHENLQPGYTGTATFSIMGSAFIGQGGQVSVQFAIGASGSFGATTAEFDTTQVWVVFSGSIA